MKRLLSLILTTAMIFSLLPTLFASAEDEVAAKAEVISYKISSDSISTAEVSPDAHFIPVETDEESANFGDLKFELRTFTDSGSTTTYETTGVKYAKPTIKNLIYNFDGDYTGISTSISNKEVGMLSYRPIEYWKHVSGKNGTIKSYTPFRKFLNTTMSLSSMKFGKSWGILYEGGNPVSYTLPPTLDLSKTAPFELYAKGLLSSHAWLESAAYYGSFYIGTESDPDANFGTFGTISGPNFPVRIKIPENAVAGKYTLRVGNNRVGKYGIYGDNNAARTFVYITKIDPETGLEGLFDGQSKKGGLFAGFADKNGNPVDRSVYASNENLLGTYTCLSQSATDFEKEIEVAPGEEYIVYFEIDGSAIDKTALNNGEYDKATVYNYNKYIYQSFKLSYIDLVPAVTEDEEYAKSFDAEEETYETHGKAEGWICYNNGETYTGKETDIELSGTMIFVAKYGDLLPVTVNGKSYTYGDTVELIAEDKEGKVFKGWKKNGEIVSVNKNYTFLAYENCDVEAVYADEAPNFGGKFIKILIDTFTAGDNTAIVAEFIGITGAVEKGIIANGNKIPMKGNGNQFTVEADVDGTYEGYAIIKDGTAYTQIKDGNIEVK